MLEHTTRERDRPQGGKRTSEERDTNSTEQTTSVLPHAKAKEDIPMTRRNMSRRREYLLMKYTAFIRLMFVGHKSSI